MKPPARSAPRPGARTGARREGGPPRPRRSTSGGGRRRRPIRSKLTAPAGRGRPGWRRAMGARAHVRRSGADIGARAERVSAAAILLASGGRPFCLRPQPRPSVQLFTIFFQRPIEFGIATATTARDAPDRARARRWSAEGRRRGRAGSPAPTRRSSSAGLFVVWAVVFGIGLQLVPHEGANSPYGGIGLIALFTGFFIMMGFLWAVIGE